MRGWGGAVSEFGPFFRDAEDLRGFLLSSIEFSQKMIASAEDWIRSIEGNKRFCESYGLPEPEYAEGHIRKAQESIEQHKAWIAKYQRTLAARCGPMLRVVRGK